MRVERRKAAGVTGAYRARVGLNYGPDNARVEPGETLPDDVPPSSIKWLLKQNHIEPVRKEE